MDKLNAQQRTVPEMSSLSAVIWSDKQLFHRNTEWVRFSRELIGEVNLEGLPGVSLSVLGVAQHSASEGRLDASLVFQSHNNQPHLHISQYLMPTLRSGVTTNTNSAAL